MANGFQKIELPKLNSSENSLQPKKPSFKLKTVLVAVLSLSAFGILFFFFIFQPFQELFSAVQKTGNEGRELYALIKNQDLDGSANQIKEVKENASLVKSKLSRFYWLKKVPFIGSYIKDAEYGINAGLASLNALDISIETILPYADLLGLKGKSTFVSGSADERIKTAVETLDKVLPKIDEIAKEVEIVGRELDGIDPNRYPEKIGGVEVKNYLTTVKNLYSETASLFVDAKPLLKKLPDLLGVSIPRTYLVLFQNDAELRATGGFITAYAIFKVDSGKLQVIKADDIYKLDESKNKKYPAPNSILKYHKNVFTLELRDSNLSPDFAVSMREFEKMLSESVLDFPKFDGIIAVDTHVLVESIKILGEFDIYGRKFSADIDKRCDCPKVIYELEDYATKPVAYVREERKDIIGVLLYQLMQRALGVSPSKYWGNLSQMILSEAKQKHILFYFHDGEAQKGIEALNYGGRIVKADRDYIHINDVNFAGAKSNLFVEHFINMDVNTEPDGSIVNTLTISYKNPSPASNCNLEAGQLCLNGILRNWVRIYVPSGSTLLEFIGSEKDVVTYDELDKTVFEGFLTVKPQATSEIKVRYKLPIKTEKGSDYTLLIQKQPGTEGNVWTIVNNGKKIESFPLISDKQFTVKL